ncbi:hypothetical protein G1K75_12190 [Tenacibaculum finnmarkense]|uniref:P-loop ATPase, Sll1717 family n=1 Tax=Tenacibaculum finnmarkense TaxID=2781243 RepID=UPI000C3AFF3F|nr:hypothetical protein [Tenacibaculum finnmarkense]MCD8438299.1 hypothetical protein [Tenacibaculum dicentrarchi]MCD8443177.1 hypothetical protein [Tenacibaculum dicentrarchi]MCG8806411.1 hypothetical protein [Tenacibaculum finnmarkense]MCG8857581.1 hypothetical protein [Tenacibaculum finnmarkense]SOS49463.1 conserved hypothetical protein [Tenacibaculum dicentrarchi]
MTDIKDWLPVFSVSAETDNELKEYFFHTPEVNNILESKHWLLLGRKGTGKTAIYKFLEDSRSEDINGYNTISLNFKDYPWPAHKLYKESLASELSAYQKSWRFLFLVKLLSKLIEIKELKRQDLSRELKWAKKYINKVFGNPDPNLMEVLFSKLSRVKKIKGPGFDIEDIDFNIGEFSLDDVAENKELQRTLRSNAFTLLSYFEKVYIDNVGTDKFLIILDQLDENWLDGEIEEYSKILINLINVCRNISINTDFKNVKIVPFLRTDIYDSLRFNDKNKLLQDSAIIINWDNDSLDDMFFERIKKYKPTDLKLDMSKKSGSVFEVAFVRQGTPAFKFITRRSFFRPRDVITYFNKISDVHTTNKTGLYTSKELYSAAIETSTSIYNEIIDEWSNQFPEIERLLDVLQTISVETFDFERFKDKYNNEFSNATEGDLRRDLNFLFKNSIIGQKKQGRWEYLSSLPNLKMNVERDFRTHQSLKYRLQLVESRPNQK